MEFEPPVVAWKSRGKDAVIGTSVVSSKDGSKLVLVTTPSEVVEVCSQTRKCVNHWTFRPGGPTALRLPAVRHPVSLAYFGVRGKKNGHDVLVTWKASELEVNKWKHSALPAPRAPVAGLFVHPQIPEDVVVVYENGRFECYDDAVQPVLEHSQVDGAEEDGADCKVVWATLAGSHRNPAKGMLLLSMVLQRSSTYELVVYRIVPGRDRRDARIAASLLVRQRVGPAAANTSISTCAFHAETLSWSLVWSTGEWQLEQFRQDGLAHTLHHVSTKTMTSSLIDTVNSTNNTPSHKKRKLSGGSAPASSSTPSHFVAGGVGPFSYFVVASAAAPTRIVGWDAKFGVQLAATDVQLETQTEPGVTSFGSIRSLHSSLHGEVVVAAYDRAVFLFNVRNKHSTLASVLGVYAASKTQNAAAPPALPNSVVNWADVASNKVNVAQWEQTVCSEDRAEQQLIAELVDASVTATATQFQKKFDAALQKLGRESLSFRFLLAVSRRCLDSADLGLWAPLKVLLQSQRLSARALPTLLPTLMQHDQFELLEVAIQQLTDMDERSIVRLLRFFIRKHQDGALLKYAAQSDDACERFVVALLARPTNSVFLHHAIRELQLPEVLALLAICKKRFFATQQQGAAESPSASQLCAWICALLDGHVAQLVLSATKDASVAKALEQLQALVTAQLESCERVTIRDPLYLIQVGLSGLSGALHPGASQVC
ncbi:hypothetical protein ATCC90586_001800 [Pythium insidiosum]|nr:hypothetical protein ATCC90586_001800 [Pythium insidiosum]